MANWVDGCGNCGADLPARGWFWRRVPRLGGKRKRVCQACALEIDAQTTFEAA